MVRVVDLKVLLYVVSSCVWGSQSLGYVWVAGISGVRGEERRSYCSRIWGGCVPCGYVR